MRRSFNRILFPLIAILALIFGLALWIGTPYSEMATGYKAKTLCSAAFVSGRDINGGNLDDVSIGDLEFLQIFGTKIDKEAGTVTVSFLGLNPSIAVYRKGIGATLAIGKSPKELRSETLPPIEATNHSIDEIWPQGDAVETSTDYDGIDKQKVVSVIDTAFDEPDNPLKTRAVVVVHSGRIIAERYAPGFSPDMPLKGWSMTKSVTNALIGILVRQGKIALDDVDLLNKWRSEDDPRRSISLDNMLRMSSGLDFNENYSADPKGDIAMMLFRSGDAAAFAATKSLVKPPGTFFEYSSGSSILLCRIIRETIGSDEAYHTFPRRELFDKIGAKSAVMERDASGTFIGSSYMYATARDWAKLGLLFANDGIWGNERILPEGWVDYSRSPAPADAKKTFGAHFWLKTPKVENLTPLPAGTFHMSGHEGQYVSILPEKDLVVVRLGLTAKPGAWKQEAFVAKILEAIDP